MPSQETTVKKVGAARQHQVSKELSETRQSLSDIEMPFRVENVTLMSPGTWNSKQYKTSEIRKAYERTDWQDQEVRSLFNEHDDEDSRHWIGEVKNARMEGDELVADLDIVTAEEARKVAYGARFGISPKVSGIDRADVLTKFTYDNFSLVLDPAVKTTYLNSEQKTNDDDEDVQGVKNVTVNSTMSEDTQELSDEDVAKVEEIVSTVENSDVEELANVIAPFVGDASAEELQPVVEETIENSKHGDEEEEMKGMKDEEEMRDMEEIARQAAQEVVAEMGDDESGSDDEGDEGETAEESLSVDEVAEKVAEQIEIENSEEEDEEDEDDSEVEALKEELSEIKEQLSSEDEEDKTTIENKTPNPGSENTGAEGQDKSVEEMSDKEIDKGAAKYILQKQARDL